MTALALWGCGLSLLCVAGCAVEAWLERRR